MTQRWPEKQLGEVCERVTVGHVGTTSSLYREEGVLFLRTQNVTKEGLALGDRKYIAREAHGRLRKSEVKACDVLISRVITHAVHCALVPPGLGPANCANVILVRPGVELVPEFLEQYIRSPVAQRHLLDRKVGSAQLVVNTTVVKRWSIPVPPLSEQQRIVGILGEAFAGIAAAKANAEKSRQNASALFERYLNLIFSEACSAGESAVLADLAADITDGDHMPPPKAEAGVPFITIRNIDKATREIDFCDTFKVPQAYFSALKPNRKPRRGDVLYTVTGSFGIPVLVRDSRDFCFQRHVALVRPKPDVLSEWLCYLLMSPQIFKQASEGATGTAQKTVSLKLLRGFRVPKLPMDRQREDVARLDALAAETRRLQSIYQRKLAALDELKQSLLHRAFSGQL